MHVTAARIRVLLVEPHADTRELYELGLTAAGFDVVAVADASAAMVACANLQPSIVVSETRLPDYGELMTRLADAGVPVIALTTDQRYHLCPLDAGSRAVLLKPCSPDEVAGAICAALKLPFGNS
jgi:DNA-binding response OmpR family regulator